MSLRALLGAEIFDGDTLVTGQALLLEGDIYRGLCPLDRLPADCQQHNLEGGTLLPGFVDLQVNGGGGVMFNDDPSPDTLETISAAHLAMGTRALLPTLITDTPEKTRAAIEAAARACAEGVPGIIGLHLEGPHLSVGRKGAHDARLIRPIGAADEALLIEAAARLPNLLVTVAPETVSPPQIRRLVEAGVIVSLGHSDCCLEQARAAFDAGARGVTHLFNAMSQLAGRSPGLVGAALSQDGISAGLIADLIHVHPASLRLAIQAKSTAQGIFLVTDAMATAGSEITEFQLNGRSIHRQDGRLTLSDGTLAGADLDMPRAVSLLTDQVGVDRRTALSMATSWPTRLLRKSGGFGRFTIGQPWHGIYLDRAGRYAPLPD